MRNVHKESENKSVDRRELHELPEALGSGVPPSGNDKEPNRIFIKEEPESRENDQAERLFTEDRKRHRDTKVARVPCTRCERKDVACCIGPERSPVEVKDCADDAAQ